MVVAIRLRTRTTVFATTPGRGSLRSAPPPRVRANEARGSGSIPGEDGVDTTAATIIHGKDEVGQQVYASIASVWD